ncbi:MAG: BatD family protein, partial [Candidatus Promineifilaceae bacterium]|nr:BatD family protein [Candidatus Promineifilaceae bacterium]
MKKSKQIGIIIIITAILGLFALPALAQAQAPVTATADRSQLTTDEALVLTITIDSSAGRASQPTLPVLDGFQVESSSSSTQISIVNGNMTRSVNYMYTLRPTRAGQLTINPISVQIGGQVYATEPIIVEVSQGTGQLQPAPNPGMPSMPSMPGFP